VSYSFVKVRDYILLGIAVVLGGVYVLKFTDWLVSKPIQIEHSARSARNAWGSQGRVKLTGASADMPYNLSFSFHESCRLTSLEVVPADAYKTNKYARRLWSLVSRSGSEPVSGFSYGQMVPGMRPESPSDEVLPLEPGVTYHVIIKSHSRIGEDNFEVPLQAAASR
jgi:hypothetical protein